MKKQESLELKNLGYTILRRVVSNDWLEKLSDAVDKSFAKHRIIQLMQNSDIKSRGVALHVLLSDVVFLDFLKYLQEMGFVNNLEVEFFMSKCILNSMSALNNLPNKTNFSALIHRDLRFYSGGLPAMINCLVMVDDFTTENGATYILPYSHLREEKPTANFFKENSIQATGRRGDILIFNSNVFHAAAPNFTNEDRRAIPITISRSFMKQLLDYPRAIGYTEMGKFTYEFQQFLGYHSRVPESLDEFYQPEEFRFYKKNQD